MQLSVPKFHFNDFVASHIIFHLDQAHNIYARARKICFKWVPHDEKESKKIVKI